MSGSLFRFDTFELDRENFQLRSSGQCVRLQKVPLELLLLLADREGQLVTRSEITERIWGKDVFLDADSAVNTAIRKVRLALGDDSDQPKYIETVPGKGYRFIAQIRPGFREMRSVEKDSVLCRPMIAVLPLEDFSDNTEDYFSEGMTEEILTHLGRLHPQLGVISRTSVMKYKGTRKSMRQIGRELGVAYALEGSVRRHAGRGRVSVQLIETLNQTHVWAESYEYLLDDILELQDRLAREIASRISLQLKAEAPAVVTSTVRIASEAYEAYLKGRYFGTRGSNLRSLRVSIVFKKRSPLSRHSLRPTPAWRTRTSFLDCTDFVSRPIPIRKQSKPRGRPLPSIVQFPTATSPWR
jgi:TolB-like protein